jgi:2-keto-4-pentenoate hydratase/2-oxohepta-3-ene-1,7-dioic acid hydratase in catechol pathway
MKLALYDDFRLGLVKDDRIIPVPGWRGTRDPRRAQERMARLISTFDQERPRLQRLLARGAGLQLSKVHLRAPLPRPQTLVCAAVNYLEFGQRPPAEMDAFIKSSNAVIGPDDTVVLPPAQATIFHHEAELAFVLGKRASRVPAAHALDHVFGYVAFMDISARGLNPNKRLSFFLGKSWHTFAPMGPWIVTRDEIPDPHDLRVRMWDDGQPRHDYNTSDMAHRIPDLLEFVSGVCALEPGDVVSTGTNHQGIGPVQDGETVTIEIQRIGRFSVQVQDPLKRRWPKKIDEAMAQQVIAAGRR